MSEETEKHSEESVEPTLSDADKQVVESMNAAVIELARQGGDHAVHNMYTEAIVKALCDKGLMDEKEWWGRVKKAAEEVTQALLDRERELLRNRRSSHFSAEEL